MQAIFLTVAGMIVGALTSFWAGRYFFGRPSKNCLAIYDKVSIDGLFYGVDQEIRDELQIRFRGEIVEDLTVRELIVANEGVNAIRSPIEPLTFTLTGSRIRVFDASITYVSPEGREVDTEIVNEHAFRCPWQLLNPNEYFYIKMITDRSWEKEDISATIVAENLPPQLLVRSGSYQGSGGLSMGPVIAALVALGAATCIVLPVVGLFQYAQSLFPFQSGGFVFVWWLSPAMVIDIVIALLTAIITVSMFTGWLIDTGFRRRKTFKRPSRPYPRHMYGYGLPRSAEFESAATRYPRGATEEAPRS